MLLHIMAKVKKSDTNKKVETTVEATTTQSTTTDTVDMKTKGTNKKSVSKKTKVEETVVVPQETQQIVSDDVVNTTMPENTTVDGFTDFITKLQSIISGLNSLKAEFRQLEKKTVKELKVAQKFQNKRKRKSSNRSPSGFVKPTLISSELASFLKKPEGSEMARTEVTREINSYIRLHNLQDKENGRKINPDAQLAKLLKIQNGEELTYFNLQRYMSPHFAKMNKETKEVTLTDN